MAAGSVLVASALLYLVLRKAVLPLKDRVAARTSFPWDDVILDPRFRRWWALLFPAVLVHLGIFVVPGLGELWSEFWLRTTAAVAIFIGTLATTALLRAGTNVYEKLPTSRERPIKGYLQVVQIVVLTFGGIWMLAVLSNESVWFFLSGLGAVAAVLLLFYRDMILSFVASMQLAQNEMIRVGDWIEMPQFNANGMVIDMALATVKILNWDNTTTTIPTHKLTSESFKNWRSMEEAGARRIMRAVNLDLSSVRFLTDNEITRYSLTPAGAADHDQDAPDETKVSRVEAAEDWRPTNVDALRGYLIAYLGRRRELDTETKPFVVRQLPPGRHGLPIEFYVFSRETSWGDVRGASGPHCWPHPGFAATVRFESALRTN